MASGRFGVADRADRGPQLAGRGSWAADRGPRRAADRPWAADRGPRMGCRSRVGRGWAADRGWSADGGPQTVAWTAGRGPRLEVDLARLPPWRPCGRAQRPRTRRRGRNSHAPVNRRVSPGIDARRPGAPSQPSARARSAPFPRDYRALSPATNEGRGRPADSHRGFLLGREQVALNRSTASSRHGPRSLAWSDRRVRQALIHRHRLRRRTHTAGVRCPNDAVRRRHRHLRARYPLESSPM